MEGRILTPLRAPQRATSGLGTRLRQLRVAAGLTQSELAGDRFSKEYMSQIERGKTRPTKETLSWIGERLGVDVSYLETGQSWDEYAEVEAAVTRAEAAVEGQQYEEALEALAGLQFSPEARELEFRALLTEAWARMHDAELRPALELLIRARELSEESGFSDVERADVLYRMGICRYKLTSINTAQTLLSEALDLADRSGIPCDRLRSHILEWRSRCSRRQRDFEAAREDIERALELAERLDDTLTVAHITFQASLIAERDGQWLRARTLAERAKELYETHGDRQNLGRMLNNLGGLNFPARQVRRRDLVPQARVLRCARGRQRRGCSAGGLVACTGSPRSRRLGLGRRAGAPRTRVARGAPGFPGRDRQCTDRPRPCSARTGTARRSRACLRRGRAQPFTAFLCQPSRARLDGPGRSRITAR